MKNIYIIFFILTLGVISYGFSTRIETLYYAAPHFIPWDINLDKDVSLGINADVISPIEKELGSNFQPIQCSWKRCILELKEGNIDMTGTVWRNPERELYLHFIEPTYAKIPDQVCYNPTDNKLEINKYKDLYQLKKIGVERGAKVSPKFDKDSKLMKIEITKLDQLLKMLDFKRLDVVIGNEMVMDYMIKQLGLNGKFRKAPFRFNSTGEEYLAISKKSPHAKRLAEISQIIRKMKENGQIREYINYYTNDSK